MKEKAKKLAECIVPEYFFWLASLMLVLLFLSQTAPPFPQLKNTAAAVVGMAKRESKMNPFDSLEITAKSAVVYDAKTRKTIFAKDEFSVLPLASIAKVMTAITALSLIPETTLISVSADSVAQEGDSHLHIGEKWLLRDLLRLMLIESSNDGAFAISSTAGAIGLGKEGIEAGREFFINAMNLNAAALGLSSSRFYNETGLDLDLVSAGAFSSARDAAILFASAIKNYPKIFTATKFSELSLLNENGGTHSAQNTNKDIDKLPLLLASKTGYTDLAGGNLAIAFDAGFSHPIVVVALGSTEKDRFTDVEKLVWATLAYLQQN